MPQLVQEEGTCIGMRLQAGCSEGLAEGEGTLTIEWIHPWYRDSTSVQEGELQGGRKTGLWELRHPDLVERGEYWQGMRTGTWEISTPDGWTGTIRYMTPGP